MIGNLSDARWSAYYLAGVVFVFYVLAPVVVQSVAATDHYLWKLSTAGAVAVVGILVGFHVKWFDSWFDGQRKAITIRAGHFHSAVWAAFALLFIVILATADTVPLMSALRGGGEQQLSADRGNFLKTREGWEAILPYISAIMAGSIIPYSLGLLFLQKRGYRWVALFTFTFFTVVSLQKAQFLQAFAPLVVLVAQKRIWSYRALGLLVLVAGCLFYFNTVLARGEFRLPFFSDTPLAEASNAPESAAHPSEDGVEFSEYFSASYVPAGAVDHLLWRTFAVPVFTASDSFRVVDEALSGKLQFGATSSFFAPVVSIVTGTPRLNFDALVFEHQWGKSDIGRSNSVYFVEAFVNFGWIGVFVFSCIVGLVLRLFWKTPDPAMMALWPLFCMNVFQAGLIGTLLSNGFALLFMLAVFVRVQPGRPVRAEVVAPAIP